MMAGGGGRDMPNWRQRNWGIVFSFDPEGRVPLWLLTTLPPPLLSLIPWRLPLDSLWGLHDSWWWGKAQDDTMLWSQGMLEKFGWVGYQALCGDDSHAACLEASPGPHFPIYSPCPHPDYNPLLGLHIFLMLYDLLHNANSSCGSPNTSHIPLAWNAQPLAFFVILVLYPWHLWHMEVPRLGLLSKL